MRLAVIGRNGQLGRWWVRAIEANPDHVLVAAWGRDELDLADGDAVAGAVARLRPARPDALLNAAAFTAVDRCESEEALARRINADAPGGLAAACRAAGIRFVHVSTDFVFDGAARAPYREDAKPGPRTAYGRSKLAGERAVLAAAPGSLVLRTSWVFGPGRNFVRTMVEQGLRRRRAETDAPLRVVADQCGSPTYAADLARGGLALVEREAQGVVHLANAGEASWWDLARAALDAAGLGDVQVEKIAAADYPRAAPVPDYSVLDCGRAASLGVALRPWREAVSDYLRSADSPARRKAA